MARKANTIIEYRNYDLAPLFPIIILTGDEWVISDIPSGRLHFHNCLEIGICESNGGEMEFPSSSFRFEAGDVTIIGSDICHTTYSDKDHLSKWSYIFVDFEELFAPFLPLNMLTDHAAYEDLIHNSCMKINAGQYPEIAGLIKNIVNTYIWKKDNYQYNIRGLCMSLFINILNINKTKVTSINDPKISSNSLAISPALNYIQKNYMYDFSVSDLASMCSLSPTHFRRTFTQVIGESPLDYLISTRINKASTLLRTTGDSILEISESVGFTTLSSFNRHFKKLTGTSPLKYRHDNALTKDGRVIKYTGWLVPPT